MVFGGVAFRAWYFACLAALAITLTELALAWAAFPPIRSASSLLWGGLLVARPLLLVAAAAALLVPTVERLKDRLTEKGRIGIFAVSCGAGIAVVAFHIFTRVALSRDIDFHETLLGLQLAGQLLALLGGATCALALWWLVNRLLQLPWLAPTMSRFTHWIPVLLLAASALGVQLFGHLVFAPVHLVTLSGVAGACAVALACCALALSGLPAPSSHKLRWLVVALPGLVLLSTPLQRGPDGRTLAYGPAATAAPLLAGLRELSDFDGDGASPQWLLGTDCDEGNPDVGPGVIELPGDGVDQDCRGGDAPRARSDLGGQSPSLSGLPAEALDCLRAGPANEASNVLLLTIDALRADAVNERLTPSLMRLGRRSWVFSRAYAPSTMTSPSMASILSGRSVSALAEPNVLTSPVRLAPNALPRQLDEAGYRTHMLNWFQLEPSIAEAFQQRGAASVDLQPHKGQLLARTTTRLALEAARQDGPSFVWAHYLDTHAPYPLEGTVPLGYPISSASGYLRGVEYVDDSLQPLLRAMEPGGALEDAIIVVTSDHGEDLMERWRRGHGPLLFESAGRVPLFVRLPGCTPVTVEQPFSLADLAPLLRVALGHEAAQATPRAPGGAAAELDLPIVVEETPKNTLSFKRAIVTSGYKLVLDVQNGGLMLFDLLEDRQENKNIASDHPDVVARMQQAYQLWLDTRLARK